jgi:DNA primase
MSSLRNRLSSVRRTARVDVEALKQAHPVQEVLAAYGVELRRQGRAAVGRCPFHADQGRPNLYVWADTASWFCFRCSVGGDVLRFVELAEGLSFREAVQRLASAGGTDSRPVLRAARPPSTPHVKRVAVECTDRDSEELVTLRAATTLYHRRLLTDPPALQYLDQRGVDRETIESCQIGYAAGDELVSLLRWRHMDLGPALRVGLLDQRGQEFLGGRIVVPELKAEQPVWLIGRLLPCPGSLPTEQTQSTEPKYLGLRGGKPLLGIEQALELQTVIVVEGVFDFLAVRRWGYPVLALLGTHARPEVVDQLRAFMRVFLVLDQDNAGLEATLRLTDELGSAAVPVALPDGIKDVAELAPRADGQAVFASALQAATDSLEPDLGTDSTP